MSPDRIERALLFVAAAVVRYGDAYAPILDRLERELEIAKRDDPVMRARRILQSYQETPGLPAAPLALPAPVRSAPVDQRRF